MMELFLPKAAEKYTFKEYDNDTDTQERLPYKAYRRNCYQEVKRAGNKKELETTRYLSCWADHSSIASRPLHL